MTFSCQRRFGNTDDEFELHLGKWTPAGFTYLNLLAEPRPNLRAGAPPNELVEILLVAVAFRQNVSVGPR